MKKYCSLLLNSCWWNIIPKVSKDSTAPMALPFLIPEAYVMQTCTHEQSGLDCAFRGTGLVPWKEETYCSSRTWWAPCHRYLLRWGSFFMELSQLFKSRLGNWPWQSEYFRFLSCTFRLCLAPNSSVRQTRMKRKIKWAAWQQTIHLKQIFK